MIGAIQCCTNPSEARRISSIGRAEDIQIEGHINRLHYGRANVLNKDGWMIVPISCVRLDEDRVLDWLI